MTVNTNPNALKQWLQPNRWLEVFGGSTAQLKQGKKSIEVFEQADIAGRLLILGGPGSGKTTTLLELARDLIKRAQQVPEQPIPVLFELSAWKNDKQTIAKWLMADLKFRNNIPEAISHEWLSTGKLLPLLDGLDELGLPRQAKCIEKINEFLQASSRLSHIVVCCRKEEYIKGRAILGLRGAVCLQPLEPEQIKAYLQQVECSHLWKPIEDDPDGLLELAKMPLLLNLIPERWLIWLAKTLKEQKQTEFLIEKMQLNYLKTPRQNFLYVLIFVLIAMLVTGLLTVPVIGLVPGLFMGFCSGMIVGLSKDIKIVESFRFSFRNRNIYFVAVFSLLFFLLFIRLNVDLFGVLIAELSIMLIRNEIQNRDKPNQGIWESVKNTVIISSIIFLVHVLFLYSLPSLATGKTVDLIDVLTAGLRGGLLFGICFSGLPCIQHFVLRLILWWSGSIPWDYARFLRYTADRRFIQQVGGRYRFIHDLLREHFSNKQDYFINR